MLVVIPAREIAEELKGRGLSAGAKAAYPYLFLNYRGAQSQIGCEGLSNRMALVFKVVRVNQRCSLFRVFAHLGADQFESAGLGCRPTCQPASQPSPPTYPLLYATRTHNTPYPLMIVLLCS